MTQVTTRLGRVAFGVPEAPNPGVVHIGLGAFHRAHQAVYTQDAITAAGGDWGIVAVAPRSRTLVDILRAQDNLFSVTSLGDAPFSTRVIGALAGVAHLPSQPRAILDLLADPAIRVVTLTVTEKAYHLDDDVRTDLRGERDPRTVLGLLVRGLQARADAGAPPIAVVSCDNLPANGARLRRQVEQACGGFGDWVSFPATMVDRIVPAATAKTLAHAQNALGMVDLAAVDAEPYRQWVIEDDFPGGRPDWAAAGAVLTDDVTSWERLKLRVLNGVHSTLAYLGALAGHRTIAEALAMPGMAEFLTRLISDDIAPTLVPPPGVSLIDYGASVLERFANPAIEHRTLQVAMDGSQKLPQRLLHTIGERRAAGEMPTYAALAVASWIRFTGGVADNGQALPLDDPLADTIRTTAEGFVEPTRRVRALLALLEPEFADDAELIAEIAGWLSFLGANGAASTVYGAAQ
jgi:fructuronate reductase